MKIVEDKALRENLFGRLLRQPTTEGLPHQHDLWPCVRRGAAERFLARTGAEWQPSRRTALHFLRGQSAEALLMFPQVQRRPVFIYRGVICSPDEWTGTWPYPFREIKSTNMSSARVWKDLRRGEVDIYAMNGEPLTVYAQQCAIYCVAAQASGCELVIFFLHGDYAERRTRCPDCGGRLGPLGLSIYRECAECGYKSYTIDLRAYKLDFTPTELSYFAAEVFERRAGAFGRASRAPTRSAVRSEAPASPGFLCIDCEPGRLVECEHYGT